MQSRVYSESLFDLLSYARRGPGRREHLSPVEMQQVARTVRRTPEVMVKVLPNSANTLTAVRKHLTYIGRKGEIDLETDDEDKSRCGDGLLQDWDLELDEFRRKSDLTATRGREPARLVHKLVFSMPAGTPPKKVLAAVRNFARENLALKHRYAMALHTDTDQPHVHVVIKALSEQGQRLHIRKATLRQWRTEFARQLRELGVAANATSRAIRGEVAMQKPDGIYRAARRGQSTFMHSRVEGLAQQLATGTMIKDPGKSKIAATRVEVQRAWRSVEEILVLQGQPELAVQVRQFSLAMPPVYTERGLIAHNLARQKLRSETKKRDPTR